MTTKLKNYFYKEIALDAGFSEELFGFSANSIIVQANLGANCQISFDGSLVHGSVDDRHPQSPEINTQQPRIFLRGSGTVRVWAQVKRNAI